MTALTKAHLKKLNDEDLRTIALRIVNDAVNTLDTYIDEHGLTDHPDLDPTPVHEAADWLRKALTNPDGGSARASYPHYTAVCGFRNAARDIGESTTGNADKFPPWLKAVTVVGILNSVDHGGRSIAHRPSVWSLHSVLVSRGDGGFIPGHETSVGYVLNTICDSDDPRLPALAESYLQSGLQANLRPAINRATRQLALLDELADLNR